ncbi:MAG TPA: hypothetical protein VFX02_10000 [Gammaproteobacteria bacterium]|nr:hypothetical protein [Gammaproteobacteria bacterium]
MRDWTAIRAFDGLDLTESFVLSWNRDQNALRFDVDFVLTEEHPAFRPPSAEEWACFRRGILEFPNARSVKGLPKMSEVRPAVDATVENDYGHFDSFIESSPKRFEVTGDFGTFLVESDEPTVVLHADVA